MLLKIGTLFSFGVTCALAAGPQPCPGTLDFYETNGYTVRKIEMESPFGFLSIVRGQLDGIKAGLPLKEKGPFSKEDYAASFKQVHNAVDGDGAFGNSPAKFVFVSDNIQDCQVGAKTVDVAYHVYSTDPILASPKTPEARQTQMDQPATATAQANTKSSYTFMPLAGYDHSRRGFGGGEITSAVPGKIFNDFELAASGSSSSRILDAEMDGEKAPHKTLLDRIEYHLAYNNSDVPASNLQLARGVMDLRATGFSTPKDTPVAKFSFRYGASVEGGNQQSGLVPAAASAGVVTNSRYAALRFYAGTTYQTRYSSVVASYGVQRGGAGFSNLSFTKQVGDVIFSRRFPGNSHRPLDFQVRASGGGISGSKGILLNDRFFGGNSASAFIPGDSWLIPDGPVVRSIPTNRLTGGGFGGTSFYSGNLTVGKVVFRSLLIPAAINGDSGFADGIAAAENTAETFFGDDYENSSPEFLKAASDGGARLSADLKTVRQTITELRALTPAANLADVMSSIDGFARRSLNTIVSSTTPDAQGQVHALEIKTLLNPSTSLVRKLIAQLPDAEALAPAAFAERFKTSQSALETDLNGLETALDTIHNGPVGLAARARAKKDLAGPRENIDTLRNEVNVFSIAPVGIFDAGRLWPDKNGVRYAIGGGVRFSLVNVNFTLGCAVNPEPQRSLGQGRAALFVQLSYTDLFR